MAEEEPQKAPLGLPPLGYGATSMIAAGLAWASNFLVVVAGIAVWLVVMFPLALISTVAGLLGICIGLRSQNWLAAGISIVGLVVTGIVVWWSWSALTNW